MIRHCKFGYSAIVLGIIIFSFCQQPHDASSTDYNITATADSVIAVRDTLTITIHPEDAPGKEIAYCWMRDDSWNVDTVASSVYTAVWQFPDTGMHTLVVYAIDADRRISKDDTINVLVKCFIPEVVLTGDTAAFIDDTVVYKTTTSDTDGVIDHFLLWTTAGRIVHRPESDGIARILWTKNDTGYQIVCIQAIDNDGLKSIPDSLKVRVSLSVPKITSLSGDTLVSINDTAQFNCTSSDTNGRVMAYEWIVATGMPERVTVRSETLKWVWQYPDTGVQTVWVRAIDDNGVYSLTDSIAVRVTAASPTVAIHVIKEVVAGEMTQVTATTGDDDGKVLRYDWTIEKAAGDTSITTIDSSCMISWDSNDTGKHAVQVIVIDDDSLRSIPSVCTMLVRNNLPLLEPVSDTVISSLDTLTVRCILKDTMQKVIMYYRDNDGGGWDDSSTMTDFRVSYTGKSFQTIIIGAKNAMSLVGRDTFDVMFNRPPAVQLRSPRDDDTVWIGENGFPGHLPLEYSVDDSDNDQWSGFIIWGHGETQDTFQCSDTTRLPLDTIGLFNWSFHVSDSFGHHVVKNGSTHIGREHTICFAGHSIVAGVGDTTFSGGFRPDVLKSLRDSIGSYERIRAVGPLTTGFMPWNITDDSCFALSGSLAHEMLLLMDQAYPTLTADIWVLMLGVNGGFNGAEWTATADLIKRMFSRNPKARVYVLTSQPYVKVSENYRYYYNRSIRDTVAVLSEQGFSGFMVETGDSILSDGTTFNDTLAFDLVHPNIEGYRRMAAGILRVMWEREPQVVTPRKEE
jgi:lysophospholipase L1-like esterase